MIVYHVTRPEYADSIERDGFRDSTGAFMTENEYIGVWVSDIPMTPDVPWVDPGNFRDRLTRGGDRGPRVSEWG